MELGKALAIAAAEWRVQATPPRAIADNADRPGPGPLLCARVGVHEAASCYSANLTVLQATRAMLTHLIAMLT